MQKVVFNLLLGCAAVLTWSPTTRVTAQCAASSDTCPAADDHWAFSNLGDSSDDVRLGMWFDPFVGGPCSPSLGAWYPAVCEGGTVYTVNSPKCDNALEADASVCLAGGNDKLVLVQTGTSYNCNGTYMTGFDSLGYTLAIHAGHGSDQIFGAPSHDGDFYQGVLNICGGSGDDDLVGADNADYISAGSSNDFVYITKHGWDEIYGGSGMDIFHIDTDDGTDAKHVHGDSGYDCISGQPDGNGGAPPENHCGIVSDLSCYYDDSTCGSDGGVDETGQGIGSCDPPGARAA